MLVDQLLPGLQTRADGGMRREKRQIKEEGPVPVSGDEAAGLAGQALGEVLAFWAGREAVEPEVAPVGGAGIGGKVVRWLAQETPGDVLAEAVPQGVGGVIVRALVRAQVPLADVCADMLLQQFGQDRHVEGEVRTEGRFEQRRVCRRRVLSDVGQMEPRRVLAGEQAGPGRRTDGAGGVSVGEAHAFAGQPIEARRAMVSVPVANQIAPGQVVGQDHHDVRRTRRRLGAQQRPGQRRQAARAGRGAACGPQELAPGHAH